ncbi:endonuclease/exonuclease/phosphatase family protein [Streptomyces sp. A1499]|uniref:endonuclease/exonuclease/phosphatase family protein n=1 Tax=Streptomyces sp. A1499 TaxID=2563104 RepID=UPI00109EB571|nr:endonuclease/exonuclease/phosphatase family protein [Streptomyces sp. A1499]THC50045.1 endonuclease/exonuclease/phosphatase family protein [Streptomyces sp. A1499]
MPIDSRFSRRTGLRAALAATAALPVFGGALSGGPAYAAPARPGARAPEARLEVMTFNLRFASDKPPHTWAQRRPVTKELLLRAKPHVIGTQEGLYSQLRDIESDLGADYDWIGTGSGGGSRDEFMAVFYDTKRLAPLEYDHFWLSDTPDVIASNTWGARSIRMATWVRFKDLNTGGELYVLDTHLDHISQNARARSATLIAERVGRLDKAKPLVVTGDFNATAHKNVVYDTLLGAGLVDTWDAAEQRGKAYATYHGYKPLTPDGNRIDWILTRPTARVHAASMNTFSLGGQYPSDHLPVQATLTP